MEEHVQSNSAKLIPRKRSGKLTLRESTPRYQPQSKNLEYLGRTEGFGSDLEPVVCDEFILQALLDLTDESGDAPYSWQPGDLTNRELYEAIDALPEELQLDGFTRSHATLDRLYEGLSRYDVDETFLDYSKELRTALTLAWQAFHIPGGVDPKTPKEVRFEGNASAGWTWLGLKKKDVFPSAVEETKKLKKLIRQNRLHKASLPPCCVFKRTQLAPLMKPKVRTVWGYPFEVTLLEGQYAQPLIDAYSRRDSPMFIGRTAFKDLPMFIDGLFLYGDACGLDWSGFDGVHGRNIIGEAFSIIRSNLWLTDEESKELEYIEYYFINTPCVMPDGGSFIKHIGIPSGSFFTQLVGSIINFVVITTLMLRNWGGVWTRIKVLSDDSVFTVPILVDPVTKVKVGNVMNIDRWTEDAKHLFGLTLNKKKTFVASQPEGIEFLGRSSTGGSGMRDETKLLRLALYPEYRVEDPMISVSRIRGILLDSGFKSWKIYDLYDCMEEKFGPEAAPSRDKKWKYIAQQDVPSGRVRMTRLWAIGA